MTKKEAIKLEMSKMVKERLDETQDLKLTIDRAMMEYKASTENKLKRRLTQIFADSKTTLYLRIDILCVNLC